jgi:uracil-DNA glycosylase
MSLLPKNIHSSWNDFLTSEICEELNYIEGKLGHCFNPDREHVLRFLTTSLYNVKIVILGQDPYPQKGVATGRAFEVGTLRTWNMPFRQVSLKNFVRLIYKSVNNIENYDEIPSFEHIIRLRNSGKFNILEPPELFDSLERQGVLFLNTCFSVIPGKPKSHNEIWQDFTKKLLNWLSNKKPNLYWFLWGKNAQSLKSYINSGTFFESRHPMMCSKKYQDDFLKSNCIEKTLKIVDWTGAI